MADLDLKAIRKQAERSDELTDRKLTLPTTMLALLDRLEAAERALADAEEMLPQLSLVNPKDRMARGAWFNRTMEARMLARNSQK